MSALVHGLLGVLAIRGLAWLFAPKTEKELMDHARGTCERRGGVFYDKDLDNGVHQLCHDIRLIPAPTPTTNRVRGAAHSLEPHGSECLEDGLWHFSHLTRRLTSGM
jgi:hypothetical protein